MIGADAGVRGAEAPDQHRVESPRSSSTISSQGRLFASSAAASGKAQMGLRRPCFSHLQKSDGISRFQSSKASLSVNCQR